MRDPEDLRRFARMDYAAIARLKAEYWRDFHKKNGMIAAFRIADELRKQVLAQRPDWPSEKERSEDWASHWKHIELLERASARRSSASR